jgi:glycine receptor
MPPAIKGHPLRVFTGFYIESMSNFQAAQMVFIIPSIPIRIFFFQSFDVDLYLYSNWKDPSLNHTSRQLVLINDPRVREKIWLPDLYFANAKTSTFHEVTSPNFNLFIADDGQIASSTR